MRKAKEAARAPFVRSNGSDERSRVGYFLVGAFFVVAAFLSSFFMPFS